MRIRLANFYRFDQPFWLTKIMGTVCFGAAVLFFVLYLLSGLWVPFVGAAIAGLLFTPMCYGMEAMK